MAQLTLRLRRNRQPVTDDIAYRGPLSYRHFKIIGWLLFVARMLIPPLVLVTKMDAGIAEMLSTPIGVMELLTPLSVFFLLIASLSQLLVEQDYKREMIANGGAALAVIVLFNLVYHRYIVGSLDAFVANREETLAICDLVFSTLSPTGFVTMNVFLDLFLCTCVMFFLKYRPARFFTGWRLKLFRSLACLPVIYEVICLWLKLEAHSGDVHMPISFFPFLPTKPPMMFFAICAMFFYQATLEGRFLAAGHTRNEFAAYLGSNRNSWDFAKFAAITCLVAGVIDVIAAYVAVANDPNGGIAVVMRIWREEESVRFLGVVNKYLNAGFAGSAQLILFAPIMLLFNYTKTYENTDIEHYIPLFSIVLLLIIYLEGALFAVTELGRITREEVMPAIVQTLENIERDVNRVFGPNGELEQLVRELTVSMETQEGASSSPGTQGQASSDGGTAASEDDEPASRADTSSSSEDPKPTSLSGTTTSKDAEDSSRDPKPDTKKSAEGSETASEGSGTTSQRATSASEEPKSTSRGDASSSSDDPKSTSRRGSTATEDAKGSSRDAGSDPRESTKGSETASEDSKATSEDEGPTSRESRPTPKKTSGNTSSSPRDGE